MMFSVGKGSPASYKDFAFFCCENIRRSGGNIAGPQGWKTTAQRLTSISHGLVRNELRVPHICPVLADVGFHKLRPLRVQGVADHGPENLLLVESHGWTAVESHICQNRADMGHP